MIIIIIIIIVIIIIITNIIMYNNDITIYSSTIAPLMKYIIKIKIMTILIKIINKN